MNKSDIIRKLSSRKLWLAVSDFVAMLLYAFGYAENTVAQIVALIMAGAGVLAYILAEGWADAAGAGAAVTNTGLVLEGIDVDDLDDDQLRSVLQQMGFGYTDTMTREQLLEALDEAAE